MTRPSDEEHARHAARHVFNKPEKTVEDRVEKLRDQGVADEATLRDHTLNTMTADDTKCFRGAHGRESYANDRTNTIVHTRDGQPESNSVYYNDERDIEGGRSATQRLRDMASGERRDHQDFPCEIRTGGSKALEGDRAAEVDQSSSQSGERQAVQASEPAQESAEQAPRRNPPPSPPPPPQNTLTSDQTQSQGRSR